MEGEDGVIDQDYSLNAARYVGVVIEDDGLTEKEYRDEISKLQKEIDELQQSSKKLEENIYDSITRLLEV